MSEEVRPEELDITDELIAERKSFTPGETPPDMTPWMRPIVAGIDLLNLWVGRITCLITIPLILAIVFEVLSRQAFAMFASWDMADTARELGLGPTLWVYEFARMAAGVLFMLGAGYALMRGVHIRADFIYRTWSTQRQATVDAVLYLLFYFPAMLFFFWVSFEFTWKAWMTWERAMDTTLMAPLAPARSAMPAAAALLFLQGISELLKCFYDMGESRRRTFIKAMPVYVVVLALVFLGTVYPNTIPLGAWWASLMGGVGLGGFESEVIGIIMIAVMLFSIFVGFPISFTLIFLAFVFGAWGFQAKLAFYLQTFQFNATMLDDQLVAVPLFVFMGIVMEKAGLMERLFTAIQMMFSRTRGALFVAVLFVSMIFAAATGIVGASVTILGIMAARTMNKSGYDVRLASGTITAGGTLGILIPPSIMLVVMGPVLEVPVTTLFQAAIIPGVLLAFLYMLYALARCWLDESLGPILPPEEQPETSDHYLLEAGLVLFSLILFVRLCVMGATGAFADLFPLAGLLIPVAWVSLMGLGYRSFAAIRIIAPAAVLLALVYAVWNFTPDISAFLNTVGTVVHVIWIAFLAALLWFTVADLWLEKDAHLHFRFSELWYDFFMGLVPPATLIAFALGSILAGWATPSEAAACGAFGALLLSLVYRKLTLPSFYDSLIKTLEITVLIMFLVAASNFFGAVFSRLGTPSMLTDLLLAMDLSPAMVLIFIMALIFLLGWPLEWVPIVLIIVPIMVPTVLALDLPYFTSPEMLLTWFAILVAVNLQTAWLSPPVALSAYFLKGVVPEWDLKDIYLGMMQFMVIQLIGLILVFVFPQIALWLPNYIYGQ